MIKVKPSKQKSQTNNLYIYIYIFIWSKEQPQWFIFIILIFLLYNKNEDKSKSFFTTQYVHQLEQCFSTFCSSRNPRALIFISEEPLALKYEIYNFSSKYQHHATFIASKYNIPPPMTVLPHFKSLLDFGEIGYKKTCILNYNT